MSFVYIVIENSDEELPGGGVFPTSYKTFEEAKAAAIGTYQDELKRQVEEIGDNSPIEGVNVPESKTGFTTLYIEKGIYLYIHKLRVKSSGDKRPSSAKANTRRSKSRGKMYF